MKTLDPIVKKAVDWYASNRFIYQALAKKAENIVGEILEYNARASKYLVVMVNRKKGEFAGDISICRRFKSYQRRQQKHI